LTTRNRGYSVIESRELISLAWLSAGIFGINDVFWAGCTANVIIGILSFSFLFRTIKSRKETHQGGLEQWRLNVKNHYSYLHQDALTGKPGLLNWKSQVAIKTQ